MNMAVFLYPRRMKYYIPILTLIYEKAIYWELDWGKMVTKFMNSKYNSWTEEEKLEVQDFVDYLEYIGQTPQDWDINWGIGRKVTDDYANNEIHESVKRYYIRQKVQNFFEDYLRKVPE